MAYLSIKLDYVAALREVRKLKTPDPAHAVALAEIGGADGITVHVRRDRRHFRDRDLFILREVTRTRLTVEMEPSEENIKRIMEVKPHMVTFVPEVEGETTTQTGLNPALNSGQLEDATRRLQEMGLQISILVDPEPEIIKQIARIRPEAVKIYTGYYSSAKSDKDGMRELGRIEKAAQAAAKSELAVMAGQGLDYGNIRPLARMGLVDEFTIGQAVVARAVMVGMEAAVRDIRQIITSEISS